MIWADNLAIYYDIVVLYYTIREENYYVKNPLLDLHFWI